MALQEFGIGVVIGGLVASSFKNSVKYASTSITQIDKDVKKLSRTKLDIKTFKELSKDASKNRVKLAQFGRSLKNAGIDTKNLDRDTKLLRLSLVHLKKASKIQIKIDSNKAQFAQQKASIIGIGASLYGVTKMIGSANNVIKAQGEIKSLGITEKGINAITKAGNEMSLQFGQITGPAFIKASYDIKSGIASLSDEGVKDMTKMAATTAVATKASIADMTKLYALGYGIFREDFSSDMDFGKQFSGAISGAVQAFRTDGADLSAGISNIGASAKAMGVSLEEELAIVGLSKSAFNSASEAGSGYRAFLDGTGKAQKELGLKFVDANGKMLPMVQILQKIKDKYGKLDLAEIDELKKGFGSSEAVKTITALLPKIDALESAQKNLKKSMNGGLSKSQQMAAAMDSGYGFEKMSNAMDYMGFTIGKVLSPAVDVLATGLGGIAKGLNWVDEKAGWLIPTVVGLGAGILGVITILKVATLTQLGYSLVMNTLKKSVLLNSAANFRNMMSLNRVSVATTLANTKTKAYSLWQGITATKTKLVTLATNLYGRALMFSGVTLGSLGAKMKAFSIISALTTAKTTAFSIATKMATAGQWLFNVAISANPIGAMIAGVALLGAGLVWAYNKFDWFKNGVDAVWSGIKVLFSWSPVGLLMKGFGSAFTWLESKFSWFKNSVDGMKSMASGIGDFLGFSSEEKKKKEINEVENIENTTSTKKEVNRVDFKGLKKAVAPIALSATLAASPMSIPEHKLNTQNLDIPTHKEIQTIRENNTQNTLNSSSTLAPVTKNYTIQVTVQNPSSSIDIAEAVKQAIKDIEAGDRENSMEDTY